MTEKIPHYAISILRSHALRVTALLICLMLSISANAEPRKQTAGKTVADREFTIVIDAGHGGQDHGAIDNGAREKDINLGVATKLASMLRKKLKNVKVVMTRTDDRFISLQERANIANRNKGNLFISIHTNSVDKNNPNRKSVAGASVYALGPQKDANNLKVAQRENSVIELEDNYHQKYSGFDPSKDESYIIFEMAQKKNLGQSLKFAEKVQKELVASGRKDRGVKQAGFWVLWATSMPSVLVELDFICNPDEAKFLNSSEGQERLATALYKAVDGYVKSYTGQANNVSPTADPSPAASTTATTTAAAGFSEDGVNTLVASSPSAPREKSGPREHVAQKPNYSKGGSRRRRNDNSRKISESRSYETADITLKSEGEFIARHEVAEQKVEVKPDPSVNDKSKNKKKDKKKNKKDNKKQNKKQDKKQNKKQNSNTKTITVQSSTPFGATSVAMNPTDDKKKQENSSQADKSKSKQVKSSSKSGKKVIQVRKSSDSKTNNATASTVATASNATAASASTASNPVSSTVNYGVGAAGETVYTILLLTSDSQLSDGDKAFCGLVPTGMYKENNQYKYTYGSSSNRREIEQKLLDVKSILPGATIVVRNNQ